MRRWITVRAGLVWGGWWEDRKKEIPLHEKTIERTEEGMARPVNKNGDKGWPKPTMNNDRARQNRY
jgi:hypothetical protein